MSSTNSWLKKRSWASTLKNARAIPPRPISAPPIAPDGGGRPSSTADRGPTRHSTLDPARERLRVGRNNPFASARAAACGPS